MFAGNFAPRGWAFCNGQLMAISQNAALFSLLGTTYGGDGITTFALPDLRGRAAIGVGQGPGRQQRDLGEAGGAEQVTLTTANLPAHNHTVAVRAADGSTKLPTQGYNATGGGYGTPATGTAPADTIGVTGGNQPIGNMPPFLAISYIICLEGIYPSRS